MSHHKKYILDHNTVSKKLTRLALEVAENNIDEKEILLVGIASNGVVLAKNIQHIMAKYTDVKTQLITLSLNKKMPEAVDLDMQINFDDKVILLVDDVTNSGRTLLYALKPFLAFHPKKIETLVLVERTHTKFPISADYKGLSIATTLQEHIYVEVDGNTITGAYMD